MSQGTRSQPGQIQGLANDADGAADFSGDDYDGSTDQQLDDEDDSELEAGELHDDEAAAEEDDDPVSLDTYYFEYEEWKVENLDKVIVTALFASDRALAVGTSTGGIMLYSADGTCELRTKDKTLRGHDSAIKDICVDENCDYVGAVSAGGTLTIESACDDDYYIHRFDRPMHTLSLHPQYKVHDDKPFICAGYEGKVILSHRGYFFGNRKMSVIDENDGKVFCARWNPSGHVVAWATERSVVLASVRTAKKSVFFRHARGPHAWRAELFRCSMFWQSESRLVIAWCNQVWCIEVKQSMLAPTAELQHFWHTDRTDVGNQVAWPIGLCGLQPYDEGRFVAVATSDHDGSVPALQFSLLEQRMGAVQSDDHLEVGGGRVPNASEFIFIQTKDDRGPEFANYLLAHPTGAHLKVRRVNDDDRVQYLRSHDMLEEAYNFVRTKNVTLVKESKERLGAELCDALFERKEFIKIARLLREVIGTGAGASRRWEEWIDRFLQAKQAHMLLPYVPRHSTSRDGSETIPISAAAYELLLNEVLHTNVPSFKHFLEEFQGHYDPRTVCNAAQARLSRLKQMPKAGDTRLQTAVALLHECVGKLYESMGRFDEAYQVFKTVNEPTTLFRFLRVHKLYNEIAEELSFLCQKDVKETLALLVELAMLPEADQKVFPLAPSKIMAKLRIRPQVQWDYYTTLANACDPSRAPPLTPNCPKPPTVLQDDEDPTRYADRLSAVVRDNYNDLVQRCIDYAPGHFRAFLRHFGDFGDVNDTKKICMEHGMYEEAALLQAKTGGKKDALVMLVEKLKSVPKAVAFIHEWGDQDIKDDLFRTLVATALEVEETLQGPKGFRYDTHRTREQDTWESIAAKYDVNAQRLMEFNSNAARPPNPTKVPVNLIEALLASVADSQSGGIDPIYLIRQLPPNSIIPNLAERLTRVATGKKSHMRLMATIIELLNGDIHAAHVSKTRYSMRAVRVTSHQLPCHRCGEEVAVTKHNTVVFRCGHIMHCHCALYEMCDRGALRLPDEIATLEASAFEKAASAFFRRRDGSIKPHARWQGPFPFCTQCGGS